MKTTKALFGKKQGIKKDKLHRQASPIHITQVYTTIQYTKRMYFVRFKLNKYIVPVLFSLKCFSFLVLRIFLAL